MIDEVLIGIFLSTLLGALIGVQREMKLQKEHYMDFAGFRTFTFISILGFLIGYLSFNIINNYYLIILSIFGFFILMIFSYIILSKKYKNYVSETSQIVAMIVFIIGILVSLKMYYVSIFLTVLIMALLVLGNSLHSFARKVSRGEILATVNFLLISFIILPILPNENFGFLNVALLSDFLLNYFSYETLLEFQIFNLYEIWLLVVFISSITYFGYIFMKTLGSKRGTILTGILGGFMSSTALTLSFSEESRKYKLLNNTLACSIILASSIMFFRIVLEVGVVNPSLLFSVLFLLIIGSIGISLGLLYLRNKNHVINSNIKYSSPFSIGPALKFGIFFVLIIFLSKLFSIYFGSSGIYIIAFFSGLTDVDAITLSLSRLALEGSISNINATIGIFIAAISNTLVKLGIVYFIGNNDLFKKVGIVFSVMILIGLFLMIV